MKPKQRFTTRQFCKSTLALLLSVQAISSLMNNPWMNAYSDETNYAGFHSAAEVRAAAERNIALAARAGAEASALSDEPSIDDGLLSPETAVAVPEIAVLERHESHEPAIVPPTVAASTFNFPGGPIVALGDDSLDDVRGGFDIADTNLKYSFGIERAVYINGDLVAHTTLNLKDLGQVAGRGEISPQASSELSTGTISVVQNGADHRIVTQAGSGSTATVIQNSLNNQTIRNVTTINAAVNSAQVLRAMSVQSAIHNGIVNSLRR